MEGLEDSPVAASVITAVKEYVRLGWSTSRVSRSVDVVDVETVEQGAALQGLIVAEMVTMELSPTLDPTTDTVLESNCERTGEFCSAVLLAVLGKVLNLSTILPSAPETEYPVESLSPRSTADWPATTFDVTLRQFDEQLAGDAFSRVGASTSQARLTIAFPPGSARTPVILSQPWLTLQHSSARGMRLGVRKSWTPDFAKAVLTLPAQRQQILLKAVMMRPLMCWY